MKTTFINTSKEGRKELRAKGRKHLESRTTDLNFFMNYGTDSDSGYNSKEREELTAEQWEELNAKITGGVGPFYDYGLSIDYVTPGTFKNRAGYFRYQLSWGGSSEEIRFYFTPNAREAYKIEFVYLDWFVGVGFDVTNDDWAKWLFDWFNEVGTIESEMNKAFEIEN